MFLQKTDLTDRSDFPLTLDGEDVEEQLESILALEGLLDVDLAQEVNPPVRDEGLPALGCTHDRHDHLRPQIY